MNKNTSNSPYASMSDEELLSMCRKTGMENTENTTRDKMISWLVQRAEAEQGGEPLTPEQNESRIMGKIEEGQDPRGRPKTLTSQNAERQERIQEHKDKFAEVAASQDVEIGPVSEDESVNRGTKAENIREAKEAQKE